MTLEDMLFAPGLAHFLVVAGAVLLLTTAFVAHLLRLLLRAAATPPMPRR